jgi:hypothetical protein
MEQKITVRNNQNLFDLAFQEAGNIEAVLDLMMLNGMPITQVMAPGQQVRFEMQDKYLSDNYSYIKGKSLHPSTGNTDFETAPELQGIDFWAISDDFITQ